jgi:hypothetical protein
MHSRMSDVMVVITDGTGAHVAGTAEYRNQPTISWSPSCSNR